MKLSRRSFLGKLSLLAPFSSLTPYYFSSPSTFLAANQSANDRFSIGFIGCGGMGWGDVHELANFGNIVALCDVDDQRTARYKNDEKLCPKQQDVLVSRDYRKVLDRNDIEIIGISTCDHWHTKIAVEALLAGKHVFCQKPLTLTIEENQLIRKAVEKTGKQFLVGTQQRTDRNYFMVATAMIRKGLLGDIQKINVYLNKGKPQGPFQTATPPDSFDWNQWLGQAPEVDYIPQRTHGTFRYWLDYSGGLLTDWGAHHVDCAQWAVGEDQIGCGPVEIDGTDCSHSSPLDEKGYPVENNRFNTAIDFNIKCQFASGLKMNVQTSDDNGILFEGTEGRIFVNRGKISGKPIEDNLHKQITEDDLVALNHGKPVEWTKQNFVRCIQEGGLPSSDVFSHTISMNTCHLCVIAGRLKRVIQWNPQTETIIGDEQAAAFLSRPQRKGFELPKVD
ncbi:MAG: Gfo/Idh/MocA family oxidoreductase [Planctomycetia bacterium]|nr:Gfo/Idh/MocA family oxidoreductase [Planctomycetia bacterium]